MKPGISKSKRRFMVILNYGCILLFLAFFNIGKYDIWNAPIVIAMIVVLVAALVSFIYLHIRTRLWKLVHAKADKLDERQIQITHESLRYSYSIFTVISLVVLLCIALIAGRYDSTLILIFASLLYLAHTLPSSVLAWTEKEV